MLRTINLHEKNEIKKTKIAIKKFKTISKTNDEPKKP